MKSLELYKKLSREDNLYLNDYLAYQSIYDCARNRNITLDDKVVTDLKEIIIDYYTEDSQWHFSVPRIADFISTHYLDDDITLDELGEIHYTDMFDAIENDSISMVLEQDTPILNKSTPTYLSSNYNLEDIKDNVVYAYPIGFDSYADYFLMKKIDDKVITNFAWKQEDERLRLVEDIEDTNIEYFIVNYDDFKKDRVDYFYNKMLDCYEQYNKEQEIPPVGFNLIHNELKINQFDDFELRQIMRDEERER
ncbi:MAG: hypothetical protein IJY25_04015 [Bacilli bacterium]|nr:hypothetical protein [Bacilli bacterium]